MWINISPHLSFYCEFLLLFVIDFYNSFVKHELLLLLHKISKMEIAIIAQKSSRNRGISFLAFFEKKWKTCGSFLLTTTQTQSVKLNSKLKHLKLKSYHIVKLNSKLKLNWAVSIALCYLLLFSLVQTHVFLVFLVLVLLLFFMRERERG